MCRSILAGYFLFAYAVALAGAVALTLRVHARTPRGHLLLPLEGDARRVVDTRVGEARMRRICEAGRCELLVGRAGGYEILASYPSWYAVEVDTSRSSMALRRLAPPPVVSITPPEAWGLVVALGLALVLALAIRVGRAAGRLDRLKRSRPAWAAADGLLRFVDSGAVAEPARPLPPGPATALFPVACTPVGGGPYRCRELETWEAVAGTAADHLEAEARALERGRCAIGFVVTLATVGAAAAVLALA